MASNRFKLKFSREFDRNFSRLPKDAQKHIINRLEELTFQPCSGKLLKGTSRGLRSLRSGDYRIIYTIDRMENEIRIFTVGHRKHVYKP